METIRDIMKTICDTRDVENFMQSYGIAEVYYRKHNTGALKEFMRDIANDVYDYTPWFTTLVVGHIANFIESNKRVNNKGEKKYDHDYWEKVHDRLKHLWKE